MDLIGIDLMKQRNEKHDSIYMAIQGALMSCIHDHGVITPNLVPSATKRAWGNLMGVLYQCVDCGDSLPYKEHVKGVKQCDRCWNKKANEVATKLAPLT